MLFNLAATATKSLIQNSDVCARLAQQQIDALRRVAATPEQHAKVTELEQALACRLKKN